MMTTPRPADQDYVDTAWIAERFGKSQITVQRHARDGRFGPPAARIGMAHVWRREDVEVAAALMGWG
jgi:predicted DNA-binding transcriptional regulator AlpA